MKINNKSLTLKTKICNYFMFQGNKSISEKFLLRSLKVLQKNINKNHENLLKLAIINVAPIIQMKQIKKKKRKTVKEFPFVLNEKNRISLSIKSILKSLNKKSNYKVYKRFSSELLTISQNKNEVLKTKEINHENALTKKKYAFFRWFC